MICAYITFSLNVIVIMFFKFYRIANVSVHISLYRSVYRFIHLSICLSIYMCGGMCVYIYTYKEMYVGLYTYILSYYNSIFNLQITFMYTRRNMLSISSLHRFSSPFFQNGGQLRFCIF